MTDIWIPRLYVLGQVAALAICGALIALGKDTVITDIFLATAGSLLGTSAAVKLKVILQSKGNTDTPSD
jgi:membrane protein DedA with SNARE-associated domain